MNLDENGPLEKNGPLGPLGLGQDSTQVVTKRKGKYRNYHCRLSNWTDDEYNIIKDWCVKKNAKYIIGKELGENKHPHLQLAFFLKNKISINSVDKLVDMKNGNFIRWKVDAAKGSVEDNYKYCSKEGSFETNIDPVTDFVTHGGYRDHKREDLNKLKSKQELLRPVLTEPLKNLKWLNWQNDLFEILDNPPDQRKIHWYWEPQGNCGKSTFCKYLVLEYGAVIGDGKMADVFYILKNKMVDDAFDKEYIIVLDLPRTSMEHVNYGMIERLKNGMFLAGKFESSMLFIKTPHIIVFANERPAYEKMSADRWHVVEIDEYPNKKQCFYSSRM